MVIILCWIAKFIVAVAVVVLGFWGLIKSGAWYLDTEEQQVRDGVKDPRTAILPVIER